ncbi:MAG: glycine rich domain-containing protein [Bacilli bacterium]
MATYTAPNYPTQLVAGDIINFPFLNGAYSWNLPEGANLRFEVWGASGWQRGGDTTKGRGGYAKGELSLSKGESIFCWVGGGESSGANGGRVHPLDGTRFSGGGTDFRLLANSLNNRFIVAGGGGCSGAASQPGGFGGGEFGETTSGGFGTGGAGGTQSQAGLTGNTGGFGNGGAGSSGSGGYGGSGGGGWCGGSGVIPDSSGDDDRGGGGGSGYVLTSSSIKPSGYVLTDPKYFMSNTSLIAGNETIPTPGGSTQIGNIGNGYARITVLSLTIITHPGDELFIPDRESTYRNMQFKNTLNGFTSGTGTLSTNANFMLNTISNVDNNFTDRAMRYEASKFNMIDIVIRNVSVGTECQLYWTTNNQPSESESRVVSLACTANDSFAKRYTFDLRGHAEWKDTIQSLRYDLANGTATGTIEVYSIRLWYKPPYRLRVYNETSNVPAKKIMRFNGTQWIECLGLKKATNSVWHEKLTTVTRQDRMVINARENVSGPQNSKLCVLDSGVMLACTHFGSTYRILASTDLGETWRIISTQTLSGATIVDSGITSDTSVSSGRNTALFVCATTEAASSRIHVARVDSLTNVSTLISSQITSTQTVLKGFSYSYQDSLSANIVTNHQEAGKMIAKGWLVTFTGGVPTSVSNNSTGTLSTQVPVECSFLVQGSATSLTTFAIIKIDETTRKLIAVSNRYVTNPDLYGMNAVEIFNFQGNVEINDLNACFDTGIGWFLTYNFLNVNGTNKKEVHFIRSQSSSGLSWTSPSIIAEGSIHQNSPQIKIDAKRNIYIAWDKGGDNNGLFYRVSKDLSATFEPEIKYGEGDAPSMMDLRRTFVDGIPPSINMANGKVSFYGDFTFIQ